MGTLDSLLRTRIRKACRCTIGMLLIVVVATATARAESDLDPLVQILADLDDPAVQLDILKGIQAAIDGRRAVDMPTAWRRAYLKLRGSDDREVRERSILLAAVFQDKRAIRDLFSHLEDAQQSVNWRRTALLTLVQMRAAMIEERLRAIATVPGDLRGDAIRALAAFADDALPVLLLSQYKQLAPREQQDTINTLCSRREYARALWAAIERSDVAVDDLSAFAVRQLMALEDDTISQQLETAWGTLRFTPADRRARITAYKTILTSRDIGKPDLRAGKHVFGKTCAGCHQLFGEGGKVGPNLTGAQRTNLDYVLENLIDPNALIGKDYQMSTVIVEGRVISGLISEESDTVLTIRTPTDTIKVPVDEIEARKQSQVSMMPEGMLDKLTHEQIRDLVGYLGSHGGPVK